MIKYKVLCFINYMLKDEIQYKFQNFYFEFRILVVYKWKKKKEKSKYD